MYAIRTIRLDIQLRSGTFNGEANTVTVEGLPTTVTVTKAGGENKNKCTVSVKNLKLETVKQLTTLSFKRLETYNNTLQVSAGRKGTELPVIFIGEITSAVPAISDKGELSLKIEALSGYYPNLLPTTPTSVQGLESIESLMKRFADEAKYTFQNNGVSGSVSNCIFIGSPITKAHTLARQVGIDLLIDDGRMIIQPMEAPKEGEIPLLSANTGLLGYPEFSSEGLTAVSIFNEHLQVGKYFKIESILPFATGEWQITKLEHKLQAYETTEGEWKTTVTGVLPGGNNGGGTKGNK